MYNEFGIKHYKGKWTCTAKTLYSEKTLIGRLQQYFFDLFWNFFCSDSRYLISADIIYTEPHTTVPTIWMDTALWESCSAYLSGMGIKYLIFHCTHTEKLGEKTVKAYRIDLSSVWFWSPVKSKTKRNLRNILRNYIKNTNTNRTEIKKVDISLAMEETTEKNTFMRTDFFSDASN